MTGGFYSEIDLYLKNTFILDEYRSLMIPLNHMTIARADHVNIFAKGMIYSMGGCN